MLGQISYDDEWSLTSDPVPELEHVRLVDAELLHLRRISGERGKVLCHVRFLKVQNGSKF